jgi:hypothetical protein
MYTNPPTKAFSRGGREIVVPGFEVNWFPEMKLQKNTDII